MTNTITTSLNAKRERLEKELEEVYKALNMLEANPQLAEFYDLIQSTIAPNPGILGNMFNPPFSGR